jgi:hypothetical protein
MDSLYRFKHKSSPRNNIWNTIVKLFSKHAVSLSLSLSGCHEP